MYVSKRFFFSIKENDGLLNSIPISILQLNLYKIINSNFPVKKFKIIYR